MRTVVYTLLFIGLFLAGSTMARSAEPMLVGKDIFEAVDIPSQAPQNGVHDFLLELREERPGATLLLLTHFPQGVSLEVDKAVAIYAKLLHAEAYAEVQERSDFVFEKNLGEVSSALAGGRALPERGKRDWENSFSSVTTYEVTRPSKNYVSLLFRIDMSGGGAHANWLYKAASFDRASGKKIALQDIFPGKTDTAEILTPFITATLSGRDTNPAEQDLDIGMKRIILVPEGLRVIYAPYEIAAYSEGQFIIDIPKEDLLKKGANPAIWK